MDTLQLIERSRAFSLLSVTDQFHTLTNIPKKQCEVIEQEVKNFLILCAITPDRDLQLSGILDDYWHLFILNTKLYDEFCEQVLGTKVHHSPLERNTETDENYEYASLYLNVFDCDPPKDIWNKTNTAPSLINTYFMGCRGSSKSSRHGH